MSKKTKMENENVEDYINVGEFEDVSDLEQALSGLPSDDSIIYLYRMYDRGRPKFLGKLEPGEFDLEHIKDVYGGGRFRYVAKKSGTVIKEGQFEIEGEPRLKHNDDGSNGQSTLDKYDVIKMLQDEVAALKQEVIKKSKEAESSLATMLSTLLQSQTQKTSIDDIEANLLSKLAMYKSLFSSDKPDLPVDTLFNAMSKGMEIAAAGSGEGTPLWLSVAEKLKEPLMQIAANMSQPKTGVMPVRRNPVSKPVEEKTMTDNPIIEMIRPYIPFVIVAASKNSDPGIYADLVIDNISVDKISFAKQWLCGETWFQDLVVVDQRISLQASWWSELREAILAGFSENTIDTEVNDVGS